MSLLDNPLLLIDSHCHLDAAQFDDDRLDVIERARAAGLGAIVVPGIDLHHCRQAVALADAHADIYAAVGIHPNSSGEYGAATEAELRELALYANSEANSGIPRGATSDVQREISGETQDDVTSNTSKGTIAQNIVVAFGEIGLDYYWDKVEPSRQRVAFERQLELAAALGLPVIIHSRDANEDVAAILREWVQSVDFAASPLAQRPFVGVLHAFSGDLALAEAAYGWNFVLSLGGPVTFSNAKQLHALVPQLRRDRLMLETDAPYLTPHPHRGKRNEPAHVALVCHKLAALYGISATQLAAESTALAEQFFNITVSRAGNRPTAAQNAQSAGKT